MTRKLSNWILSNRRLVLVLVALVTVGLALACLRLRIVTDFEAFFLPGDPDLANYEALKKSFGSDEFILVAYEALPGEPDVFTPQTLRNIREITRKLESAERVALVLSLTNAQEFRATGDGIPVGVPVLPVTEPNNIQVDVVRLKIAANPFYRDFLVSEDGKTSFLLVQMSNPNNENFVRLDMTETVEEILAPYDQGNIHISGTPIYLTELYRMIIQNLLWLGGAACALVIVLLWLSLRSFRGVVLPLGVLVLSLVWNMGIFGAFGAPLTIASSVVAPLIVAISVTSSIHFLLAYTAFLDEKKTPRKALETTMHHIIPPAFYSTFTTSLGFLTLTTAKVLPVVQTGLYTAAGVMGSFVLTITLVPIVLSYFPAAPVRRKAPDADQERSGMLSRALDKVADWNLRRYPYLIVFWGLVGIGGAVAIGTIRIETNPLKFFRPGTKMAQTHAYFESHLGGTLPFDMIVQGKPGDFQELKNYPNLDRLQRFLQNVPQLHGVLGTPDLMREINATLGGGRRALPYEPQTLRQQARLLDLARGRYPQVNRFVDRDWSQARFTSRIEGMSSEELAWLMKRIDAFTAENLDSNFKYEVSGIVKLLANMIEKVRDSQIASLGLAVGLLWICFIVFLRSIPLGTIAMLPNVVPIVSTLGVMGVLGIDLDLATVMMPSIAIGLAVDDTLHFFSAFKSRITEGESGPEAIRWTLHFRGRAFIYTSLILTAGFGILLFSDLRPISDFGIISAAAIGSALLADLLLNPALLRLIRPRLARWATE